MRNRKLVTLALSATALGGAVLAAPAAGATTATFTLSGGSISVTQPSGAATLTGTALSLTGSSMQGQLGSTTVKDERGALLGSLTVKMSSTAFAHGASEYTIPATAVKGYSGLVTPVGVAVPVATLPLEVGQLGPQDLSVEGGGTIVRVTGITGAATLTYNPTVTVAVPSGAPAGTYTATVTQTAS